MEPNAFTCSVFLILAFVIAGLVQTFWLRSKRSKTFSRPIDGGASFRGKRLLGDNKTWRGFIAIVPAVAIAFVALHAIFTSQSLPWLAGLWSLTSLQYGCLGLLVGLGFMIGELPNSFVKRQLGIHPGEHPSWPPAQALCFVIDRFDSILGGMLILALMVPVPMATWCCVLLLGPCIHWAFNYLLFRLGVKQRPK